MMPKSPLPAQTTERRLVVGAVRGDAWPAWTEQRRAAHDVVGVRAGVGVVAGGVEPEDRDVVVVAPAAPHDHPRVEAALTGPAARLLPGPFRPRVLRVGVEQELRLRPGPAQRRRRAHTEAAPRRAAHVPLVAAGVHRAVHVVGRADLADRGVVQVHALDEDGRRRCGRHGRIGLGGGCRGAAREGGDGEE
jgi:hypothetical protein